MHRPAHAIETSALVKHFGETRAVDGIDLEVRRASVYGLLGPNGAGKTTTIRVLATLLAPDAGRASVLGHDVVRDPAKVRSKVSLTGQFASVDEDLTGRENLVLVGRLFGYSWRDAKTRADELLDAFGLTESAGKQVRTYSGGMRRKLDIAASLVVTPELLFLDEPTTGLDPQNRRAMWDELQRLNRDGTTIFLTTQYMEEADSLCQRLAVIDHGTIVSEGSPTALKAELGGEVLTLTFPTDDPELLRGSIARGAEALRGLAGLTEVREADREVIANLTNGAHEVLPEALRRLAAGGVEARIAVSPPTLDDVFIKLTGHALREEEGKPTGWNLTARRRRGR